MGDSIVARARTRVSERVLTCPFPRQKVKSRIISKAELGFRGEYQTLMRGAYFP